MFPSEQSAARAGRDAGIRRVVVNEERRQSIDEGIAALSTFLATHDKPFIWEEFRLWALRDGGIKPPHHPNWWGGLGMAARRRQMIRKTGTYRSMSSPSSHHRETPVYVASK